MHAASPLVSALSSQLLDTLVRQLADTMDPTTAVELLACAKDVFSRIPLRLNSHDGISDAQVMRDIAREIMFFNGTEVVAADRSRLPDMMATVLAGVSGADAPALSMNILRCACRTAVGTDSYFVVRDLFSRIDDEILITPSPRAVTPMCVEVTEAGQVRLQVFSKFDVRRGQLSDKSWITVDTVLYEEGSVAPTGGRARWLTMTAGT